jgi:hypothetical protein
MFRSREVPEITESFGWLEHDGVVVLDWFRSLDYLAVGRAELRVVDVRVVVGSLEVDLVLEQRQRPRRVDNHRALVGDLVAVANGLDTPHAPVLSDVLDDRVVVDCRAGALCFLQQHLAVPLPVDHRPGAVFERNVVVLTVRVHEHRTLDVLVGERFLAEVVQVDDLGERAGPLYRVTTGNVAGVVLALSFQKYDLETVPGRCRGRECTRSSGTDDDDVVCLGCH